MQKIELEEMRLALEMANMDKSELNKKLNYFKNENDVKNKTIIKLKNYNRVWECIREEHRKT